MSSLLYITSHPLDTQSSQSLTVGEEFIKEYRTINPDDEIIHLDLYKTEIPTIDADVLHGWQKIRSDKDLFDLTTEERRKVSILAELVEQFITADKYVIVTPMWNFLFPPVLKAYIDAICIAGKAFKYTENGPIGLLTDKKALHIQARGGIYSKAPASDMEMGHRFLRVITSFLGIPTLEGIFIEGHNQFPDQVQQIKDKAVSQARDLARSF